jgi:CheY-like chemotaxis protein
MDGFTVAERLASADRPSPLIVMLTSSGDSSDASRCRQLGISAYLIKPVRQASLRDAIIELLAKARKDTGVRFEPVDAAAAPVEVVPRLTPRAATPLRVLVAEDNLVNQRLAVSLLEKAGHSTVLAANGVQAVAAFEREPFDVILMDMQMPEMSGTEAIAVIRERERCEGRHTPVVAITAHALKGDKERCLAAGADGYVPKPIVPAALFEEIERSVAGATVRAGKAGGAGGAGETGTAGEVARSEPRPTQAPVEEATPFLPARPALAASAALAIDRAGLLARVDGDRGLLQEVINLFLQEGPRLLGTVRAHLEAERMTEVYRAAHALKGSAGNFGVPEVVAAAGQVEQAAQAGDLAAAQAAFDDLESGIEAMRAGLRALQEEILCAS